MANTMIYFDNAATSFPKPDIVKCASLRAMCLCANPGRSGHDLSLTGAEVILKARTRLCNLLNCDDPTCFVFTLNCTDSLNMGIKGILNKGDHVVTTALEHNSVLRPLQTLANKDFINYSVVLPREDGIIDPDDITRSITYSTKLVIVTHASNVLGAVQPVKEIVNAVHEKNAYCMIDGAQTVGKIKVDLKDINADLYAFPGHKGLLGTMGCGVLYVKNSVPLACTRQGGTGSSSMCLHQPNEMPEKLESGTPAVSSIAALAAGTYICMNNINEFSRHTRILTNSLMQSIKKLPYTKVYSSNGATGVIAFNIGDIPSYIVSDYLSQNDIACRAGYHCAPLCHRFLGTKDQGAVRLSLGPFNTKKETDIVLETIRDFIREAYYEKK